MSSEEILKQTLSDGLSPILKNLGQCDQQVIRNFIREANKLLHDPINLNLNESKLGDCKEKKIEPLTVERGNKYVCFPIDPKFATAWVMYKQQIANFWTAEEIDMDEDVAQWANKLTEDEKHYISHILAFFAASDGIVAENLLEQFGSEIQVTEVRFFYGFQAAMEQIHSEVYSLFIETLIRDPEQRTHLFAAIETIPCVKKKAEWALKWANNNDSLAERLLAFACVEGIFFSGSFCSIFWLRKRGLMPGLTFSNELISRDENLHCEFAAYLFTNHISNRPTRERALQIVCEAVEYERVFVCDALPVDLIGMNKCLMAQYIEFVGDYTLSLLGYKAHYGSKNPFEWMNMISIQGKTNFFENRVSEYQKKGVMSKTTEMIRNMTESGYLSEKESQLLAPMLKSSLSIGKSSLESTSNRSDLVDEQSDVSRDTNSQESGEENLSPDANGNNTDYIPTVTPIANNQPNIDNSSSAYDFSIDF